VKQTVDTSGGLEVTPQKHFVTFMSPGTFVRETTQLPIDSWDPQKAMEMARDIVKRHGAKPFGFQFSTRSRGANDLDSMVTATSGVYFLGGKIETLKDVEARDDPKEKILRANMRANDIKRIITNTNSCKITVPFEDSDVLLDFEF
jgi:hypothetical protein